MSTYGAYREANEPLALATIERMVADLHALGVAEGDLLLMHSSLSSLGFVPRGPETVIRGLLQALGPEGTLLLPALSYEHVTAKDPVFDVRTTPSNVGAIPEHFRRRPGTLRSLHPTHSVCGVGPLAAELLGDHELDSTPCGPHSPFHKLRTAKGTHGAGAKLLMLGCGLRPNTSMHAIEELVVPPYLFNGPLAYTLIRADGVRVEKTYTTHGFRGWAQRYERAAGLLSAPAHGLAAPALRSGPVLEATVHLVEITALWDAVLAKLHEDPLYFVDNVPLMPWEGDEV